MMKTVLGGLSVLSPKTALGLGALGYVNRKVIFPTAASTATWLTTKTGILTHEEAANQERIFENMLFPVTDTIKDIETEVMNILIGKDAAEWVAPYVPFGKEPDMKKVESEQKPEPHG